MLEGDAAWGGCGDIGPRPFNAPIEDLYYMRRCYLASWGQGIELHAYGILRSRRGDFYYREPHDIAGIPVVGGAYRQYVATRDHLAYAINATDQPCIALWHAGVPPVPTIFTFRLV